MSLTAFCRRAHLTVNGLVLVGLGLAGWGIARWVGARSLYLIVYAWLLTMLAAGLISRRRLALDIDRSAIPLRMREGQAIPVELRISARRRASTVVIEEHLPEQLGTPVHLPLASVSPGDEVNHTYLVTPRRRGVYEIGPCTATWSDPFGLTAHDQELSGTVEVIVHPRTESVHSRVLTRMWEDPPIRPPQSKPWPTGFEFYGMREYVPGDDLRRVVWKAVAKTDRMLVRESEQGITDRITLAIDTERAWHSPGDPSATMEAGVRAAASLGVKHLHDGFAVTLLSGEGRLTAPLRGMGAEFPMLDALARLKFSKKGLRDVTPELIAEARRGTHFLIVTPHLDQAAANAIRLATDRGASATVVFLVWDETDPTGLSRATLLGCQVVQLPADASLEAVFANQVGAGTRR